MRPDYVTHYPCMAVGSGSSELSDNATVYATPDQIAEVVHPMMSPLWCLQIDTSLASPRLAS